MVATMRIIRKKGKYPPQLTSASVKVGFPAGKSSQSNIMKAIYNEFGTSGPRGVPSRPFFRTAMRNNRAKYQAKMKNDAKAILAGKVHLESVLLGLAFMAQRDIQMSILVGNWIANRPSTIRRKKSSKPLIDTGAMRQSVTWMLI
jgi:hypothetical protein